MARCLDGVEQAAIRGESFLGLVVLGIGTQPCSMNVTKKHPRKGNVVPGGYLRAPPHLPENPRLIPSIHVSSQLTITPVPRI